jgi:hypothetical protein
MLRLQFDSTRYSKCWSNYWSLVMWRRDIAAVPPEARQKDAEIDHLLAEVDRLVDRLQLTMTRINETVRTHREVSSDDE